MSDEKVEVVQENPAEVSDKKFRMDTAMKEITAILAKYNVTLFVEPTIKLGDTAEMVKEAK